MSEHTRGQWIAVGAWVEHPDDDVADICSCDPATINQEHLGRGDSEICANARLIAAAPDLLEVCRRLAEVNVFSVESEVASIIMDAVTVVRKVQEVGK